MHLKRNLIVSLIVLRIAEEITSRFQLEAGSAT